MDVRLNAERGPFTVFAPTDAAFNEFLEQFGGGGGRKAVIRLKRTGKLQEVRKSTGLIGYSDTLRTRIKCHCKQLTL